MGTILLADTDLYDFELLIPSGNSTHILKAHRIVLKALSGYFRRVLCGAHFFTWTWSVRPDQFESAVGLIRFMYTSDPSDLVHLSHTIDLCIELEMPAYYVWISHWQAISSADRASDAPCPVTPVLQAAASGESESVSGPQASHVVSTPRPCKTEPTDTATGDQTGHGVARSNKRRRVTRSSNRPLRSTNRQVLRGRTIIKHRRV